MSALPGASRPRRGPTRGRPGRAPTRGRPDALTRRARRTLYWYPRQWRARYGEEFTELLIADLAEQPRSWRRTADVARSGVLARLAGAGLASHPLDPALASRASLATLACSSAAFLTFGAAMWAQLTIGWQWAPPAARPTTVAMIVMSGAMLLSAVLAVLAILPVGWTALRASAAGRARGLPGPAPSRSPPTGRIRPRWPVSPPRSWPGW